MAARFYVYVITKDDLPLYVGKGSGRRAQVQAKKYDGIAYILEWFSREALAYKAEIRWIKELKPQFNVHPGGNGCRVKKTIRETKDKFYREIEKIGSRAYSARILLRYRYLFDRSQIKKLQEVAMLNHAIQTR